MIAGGPAMGELSSFVAIDADRARRAAEAVSR